MNSRQEIQQLTHLRLKEAKVLFANGLYDGAVYMAGYSVELALKASICKALDVDDFFSTGKYTQTKTLKTHNLADLLVFSGLQTKFRIEQANNTPTFQQWSHLSSIWSEQLRYMPEGTYRKKDAEQIISAIENPNNGILIWIQKHW